MELVGNVFNHLDTHDHIEAFVCKGKTFGEIHLLAIYPVKLVTLRIKIACGKDLLRLNVFFSDMAIKRSGKATFARTQVEDFLSGKFFSQEIENLA